MQSSQLQEFQGASRQERSCKCIWISKLSSGEQSALIIMQMLPICSSVVQFNACSKQACLCWQMHAMHLVSEQAYQLAEALDVAGHLSAWHIVCVRLFLQPFLMCIWQACGFQQSILSGASTTSQQARDEVESDEAWYSTPPHCAYECFHSFQCS